MSRNVAQKLIESHLESGDPTPGSEIGLRIDQTLTQDATGTLVMLELEAMEFDRVKTELSVQYVDHNLLEADERNADDHLFLYSACRRGAPGGAGQCASSARTAVPSCSLTVGRPSRRAATSLARSVALAGQAAYA